MALIWTSFLVILKNITSKKTRTFLTIAGISLGVAVIFAIHINNKATLTQLNKMIDDVSGKTHLVVNSKSGFFKDKVLKEISKNSNIDYAAPLGSMTSFMLKKRQRENLSLLGINPAVDREVHSYSIYKGEFNFSGPNSILLSKAFAKRNKLKIDDKIQIFTNKGPENFKIKAILNDTGIARLNYGSLVVLNISDFQKLFGLENKISQIDIKLKNSNRANIVKNSLSHQIGKQYEVSLPSARGKNVQDLLAGFKAALLTFSILSLIAGGFLVFNTLAMSVLEKTRENAMLRLVGFSKGQIFLLVIAEGMMIGLVAILIGLLGGLALSKAFALLWSNFLSTSVETDYFSATGLLISGTLALGLTLIASLKPAINASKISPLQALKAGYESNPKQSGLATASAIILLIVGLILSLRPANNNTGIIVSIVGLLVIILASGFLVFAFLNQIIAFPRLLASKVFPIVGKVSIDNIKRNRSEVALTITTLLLSIIMVVSIIAISASLKNALEDWIKATVSGDFTIRTSMSETAINLTNNVRMDPSLEEEIRNIKRVKQVTSVTFAATSAFGKRLTFVSIDPKTYQQVVSFQFLEGKANKASSELEKGNSVFVSSVISSKHNISLGDDIVLATPTGEKKFKVSGVIIDFAEGGQTVTGSMEDLRRYFKIKTVDVFAISLTDKKHLSSVKRTLEKDFGQKRGLIVQSNEDVKTLALNTLRKFSSLFNTVSLFAVTIALLGLINTLVMGIIKQAYEISVLRAVGFFKSQIKLITIIESQVITFISLFFGLLLGILLAKRIVLLISKVTGFRLVYNLPSIYLFEASIIILIVVLVTSIYPAYRATKLSIVDSLRTASV